jgi:HPt (histidine-containing phosphotransfer) domain-containing protein
MTQAQLDAVSGLPLYDGAILDGLRAALGPATDTLVEKATGILDDRMAKLHALGETPLEDEFARIAHEIAGVAGQIGLTRLSKASLALERVSREGDAAGATSVLRDVEAIADESRAAMGR